MSTVAEIESAIEQLPPEDFRALQEWITQRAVSMAERKWSAEDLAAAEKHMVEESGPDRAKALKKEIARGFFGAADA